MWVMFDVAGVSYSNVLVFAVIKSNVWLHTFVMK